MCYFIYRNSVTVIAMFCFSRTYIYHWSAKQKKKYIYFIFPQTINSSEIFKQGSDGLPLVPKRKTDLISTWMELTKEIRKLQTN